LELGKTFRKNQNEIMSNTLVLKSHFISKSPEARLYQLPIPVIGLTGGIATGKSTVAKLLAESGFAVINARFKY
jgi:dephospho-CoA kinase